jgi:ABC-2 type transport system permease protein
MCATLYAHEQQTNRWPLLNALAGSGMAVLNYRLVLRFLLLTCLNGAVLVISILLTNIAFDACAAFILGSLLLYQFFWFSICGLIIRLGLNTTASTLGFIAAWMVLVVIVPGMSNLYLTHQYATDEGIALTLKQRQFMNNAWDKDKKLALDNFLQHYPQYADTAPLGEAFDWKWYYAMQHLSDLAALPHLERYHAIMNKRRVASEYLAWLSAPLNFQQILTQVAQTDMTARHDYRLQVRHYHTQLRNFYYARLFYKTTITAADIAQYPRFVYQPPAPNLPWLPLWILMFSSIIILALTNNIGSISRLLLHRYFWRSERSQ